MAKKRRATLLLALLLVCALLLSTVLLALHEHEAEAEFCPFCQRFFRAERLISGLALLLLLLVSHTVRYAPLFCRSSFSAALRRTTPVALRVKLTN